MIDDNDASNNATEKVFLYKMFVNNQKTSGLRFQELPLLTCSVPQCPMTFAKTPLLLETLSFYELPKDPERKEVWLTAIMCEDNSSAKICSLHFTDKDYEDSASIVLKESAVPNQKLPTIESAQPAFPDDWQSNDCEPAMSTDIVDLTIEDVDIIGKATNMTE